MKRLIESKMQTLSSILARPVATLMLVASLAACGQDFTAAEHIERAQDRRADGDVRAAIVELRNALQSEPDNAEARLLLGRTYIDAGEIESAEKELRRALELGVPRERVVVGLGRTLLLRDRADALLEEIEVSDGWPNDIRANAQALRGRAYVQNGDILRAHEMLERAAEIDNEALHVYLGRIELALARGSKELARTWFQRASKQYPGEVAVWRQGALVAIERDAPGEAEDALDRAIELAANPARELLLRARVRVAQGNPDGAREDVESIKGIDSSHPRIRFVRGLIAWSEDDFETACGEFQEAVSEVPEYVEARKYLGACNYHSGKLNQAQAHLAWVHQRSPSVEVGRLLAAVQLGLQQPELARETLSPIVQQHPDDELTHALLGRAEMALGNTSEAIAHMQRLAQLRPEDSTSRLRLGTSLLRAGQSSAAQSALGEAVELDPESDEAGAMLVVSHLQAGEYDEALQAARNLTEERPDAALPWTLVGLVHAVQQEEAEARQALETALEKDAGDPAARHLLARMEMRAGDTEAARGHYEAVLAEDAEHTKTLLALAGLEARAGNAAEVLDLLTQAHQSDPDALQPRVLLGQYRLRRGDPEGALEVLTGADGVLPNHALALGIAARAQLALGRPALAISSLSRWVTLQPENAEPRLLLARAYAAAGDGAASTEQLERVLDFDPNNERALMLLARTRVRQGREADARELLARLPEEISGGAFVLNTRAEAALQAGNPARAAELYREALEVEPASATVSDLARALRRSGDGAAALAVMQDWLAEHPDDASIWLDSGDLQAARGNRQEAIEAYEEALARDPESVRAMNNLAWLLRSSEPDRAQQLAEQAVDLEPENTAVRDTLGMVLLERGEADEAARQFRQALEITPHVPELRYHLARALAESGNTEMARTEVEKALESGQAFPEREQARAFRDSLP